MDRTLMSSRTPSGWKRCLAFLLLPTLILTAGVARGDSSYEAPKNRRAAEVLPSGLVSGLHFRVQDPVLPDGYMYRFTVRSDYGIFNVTGIYGLRKLIREIQAIAALRKVDRGQALAAGVQGTAQDVMEFGADLVVNPMDTVTGVTRGVAKLFDNIASGVQNPRDPRRNTMAQDLFKVSEAKRKIAYDLGVDVYSSNRVLQDALDRVGRAQGLGAFGVSAAIPYGGGAVVGLSKMSRTATEVNRLLRDESPNGLRNLNERKLAAMGVDQGTAERFLSHTAFSPRHQTVIISCLENLSGASGREVFIRFALSAHDEETANFMQNMAEILRAYQETVSSIREIAAPGVLFARTASGAVLVPYPLDYGIWSPRAERVVKNSLACYQKGRPVCPRTELWVTGTVSPLARQQLQDLGITVLERVDRRVALMD